MSEDTIPEVLVLAAAEKSVGDGRSLLSTRVAGASTSQDSLVEEEVIHAYVSSPQLHQQRAFPLSHLLNLLWSCSTFLVDTGVCL